MYDPKTMEFARQLEALVQALESRPFREESSRAREETMRDYARVLYSSSFRRLQGKMQLLGIDANRFNRNRLTHSLEVAQIARSIAADLGMDNTVVAETSALAHDIGNPPFGHYGEKILNELAEDIGGFEGNAQTFRILRTLEKKHHAYEGLNLTLRTMLGVTKYFYRQADNRKKFLYDEDYKFLTEQLAGHSAHIEKSIDAQVMDLSDEIAYAAHDLEDALSFRMITIDELAHEFQISPEYSSACSELNSIVQHARTQAQQSAMHASSEEYSVVLRKELTSTIVNRLCQDISVVTKDGRDELGYKTLGPLAEGLKNLLFKAVLRKKDVQLYEKRGEKIIRGLFEVLTDQSYNRGRMLLPPELRKVEAKNERVVIDYIAGMMDSYAAQEYERYFGSGALDKIYFPKSEKRTPQPSDATPVAGSPDTQ
jgi:dGTPase